MGWTKMDRREFMAASGVLCAGAALSAGRAASMMGPDGNLRFETPADKLRILAVTDLHFYLKSAAKDRHTVDDIKRMAEIFKPDLLLANGDVWHENPDGKGLEYCKGACEKLSGLGLPWIFVRGNHDKADDFSECEKVIASSPGSIYRTGSEGNFVVEIAGPGGAYWNLIIVNDSAPALGFAQAQIDWLRSAVGRMSDAPAFLFCHVPIPQFEEIGKAGMARGIKRELVYYEEGSPEAFDAIKESGKIKAVFSGHDHMNDYYGDLDGVRLDYLRATGYGGYGGWRVKKGGTIIEVDPGLPSGFDAYTVFANGKTWQGEKKIRGRS